jgi:acetyl esterase/lipase
MTDRTKWNRFIGLSLAIALAGCATRQSLVGEPSAKAPSSRPTTKPATKPVYKPLLPPKRAIATTNVSYRPDETDEAVKKVCVLDIFQPADRKPVAAIVWFHGGGMTAGDKNEAMKIAQPLIDAGITLVTANYRLSPNVQYPAYVEDAAAAVAWTLDHANQAGTTADHIFVGGYSAGGFLAMATGTQPQWLAKYGKSNKDLRGIVGVSPQVFTHYTIRAERGLRDPTTLPYIDDTAPIFYASADLPPIQLFIGDHDTASRREELEYFMSILKIYKHPDATLTVTPNRTHGTMTNFADEPGDPFGTQLVKFVKTHATAAASTQPAKANAQAAPAAAR